MNPEALPIRKLNTLPFYICLSARRWEVTAKSVGWATFVVVQISKSAVSPVSKPACRGRAKPLPSVRVARFRSFLVL
jgi:hypothetical protein